MKYFNYLRILVLPILIFIINSCKDDSTDYKQKLDVPKGVYIIGTGTEFPSETINGKLKNLKGEVLYCINTWLSNEGSITISVENEDGIFSYYGIGEKLTTESSDLLSYSMQESGDSFSIEKEGFYQVIVNTVLNELHLMPYNFKIVGESFMSENDDKEIPFITVSYDKANHIITWETDNVNNTILPSIYRINYGDTRSFKVKESEILSYQINTSFTGPQNSIEANVLTNEYTDLRKESSIDLNLSKRGKYTVTVQYNIPSDKFSAKIEGDESVEPNPENYPEKLYMVGDDFGNWDWSSNDIVEMVPVGTKGNGSFWTIKYFNAGKGLKWSSEKSEAKSFISLGNNDNFVIVDNHATVQTSGLYLVYIDMHRKLVSFENPTIYGMGESFNGEAVQFNLENNIFENQTTTTGNLRMYTTSKHNDREWQSMEFNIYNEKIIYRGLNSEGQESVPVASNISIKLDFNINKGEIKTPMNIDKVPNSSEAMYMIGDNFGNMNWGSPNVENFERSYSESHRWYYVSYFEAGTGIRFSTTKMFGADGEFSSLDNNEGFSVVNGKAVISNSGIYMVYIDLNTRSVFIQRAKIYAYGSAVGSYSYTAKLLEESEDGKTVSTTLSQDGRLRFNPEIPAFSGLDPSFSAWKREMAFDPLTLKIFYRGPGDNEPNQNHIWTGGSKITLDFKSKEGKITNP